MSVTCRICSEAPARLDDSGAEGPNRGTIGRCGKAKSARRQRDHCHSVARHVEESTE